MAILTNTMSDSAGVVNYATGQLTTDGGTAAAVTLPIGFTARHFKITQTVGTGNGATMEWTEGMPNAMALIAASGAGAAISSSLGPIVTDRTVTIPSTFLAVSSSFVWEAEG